MEDSLLQYLLEWFNWFCPEPKVDIKNIATGTRTAIPYGDAVKSSSITSSCQYWMKGLSAPCSLWKLEACTYAVTPEDTPTGYGLGTCDGLGRRSWCSKYVPLGEYTIDSYTCILPSMEKSGSGMQMTSVTDYVSLRPWKISEIKGFNPDDNGVGQCDGIGMGRGAAGVGKTTVSDMRKLFTVCKHYKPHIMSFGAVAPRPFHSNPKEPSQYSWKAGTTYLPTTKELLHDGSKADPLVLMDKRLPYNFKVYNLRPSLQRCANWDDDNGGRFAIEYYGADPSEFQITIDKNPSEKCKCSDSACEPYKLLEVDSNGYVAGTVPKFIDKVWAKNGSIVCNGAKPECPCYTGKWIYCIDDKMADGMRITANQLLELRFWTSLWASQAEYDAYFTQRSGKSSDVSTADIYTFTKWKNKEEAVDVNDVIPVGKKHHMCMPKALNSKTFDPTKYVTITDQEYLPAAKYNSTGTQGPNDITFPTLVRDLSESTTLPDVEVVYPYYTDNPWLSRPCSDSEEIKTYEHANVKMSGNPTIAVVGSTLRNREVIAINTTLFEDAYSSYAVNIMKSYVRTQLIPENLREAFFTAVSAFVDACASVGRAGIIFTQSDKNGYFIAEGLELKNGSDNDIFILCRVSSLDYYNAYVYVSRTVKSTYYGAYFIQTSFSQPEGDNGSNSLPEAYGAAVRAEGMVIPINGNVEELHQVHNYMNQNVMSSSNSYGYCINRTEVEAKDHRDWTQIGITEYIFVDLGPDRLRITYQFGFELVEAYLTLRKNEDGTPAGGDKINLCGNTADTKITLERVSISNKRELPPGGLILKSNTVLGFANSDWVLYIKFKYLSLDTWKGSDVAWPTFDDISVRFVNPPWSVDWSPRPSRAGQGCDSTPMPFIVNGLKNVTAAIMAKISDASGRVQAFAATKMLFYGYKLSCRNVDIYYSWQMDAKGHHLNPLCGNAINIDKDGDLPGIGVHRRTPECGDHDCGFECRAPGYMWFPFESCGGDEYYCFYQAGAFCTQKITAGIGEASEVAKNEKLMGKACWRYVMPDEYRAWVDECAAWLKICGVQNRCYYSKTIGNLQFIGRARKKAKVDEDQYKYMGWQMPPFGNNGRAQVERWFFRDFISFPKREGIYWGVGREYAPLVFDRPDLTQDLNCFAETAEGFYDFYHFSIMSTLLGTFNNESYMPEEYYRFEDIIDLIYQGGCTYPPPVIYHPKNMNLVAVRYGFMEEDICWAWPTRWYDIERGQDEDTGTQLYFVSLKYPNYYVDYPKQEHRLTVDEEIHSVEFIPPVNKSNENSEGEETDSEGEPEEDSGNKKYASISIDGAYPRYFNIMYDDYTSGYVDWKDESSTGEENASGGEGEGEEEEQPGSIYESANNKPEDLEGPYDLSKTIWIHDPDTLFSNEASYERLDERKVVIDVILSYDPDSYSGPKYGYYNRGLIAKIPKSMLNRLPLDEDTQEGELVAPEEDVVGDGSIVYNFDLSDSDYTAATKIIVMGSWGVFIDGTEQEEESGLSNVFSKPGIQLSEIFVDEYDEDEGMVFREDHIIREMGPKSGYELAKEQSESEITYFKLEFSLSTYPNRMNRKVKYFQIKLIPSVTLGKHESLNVSSVTATVGKYKNETELIKCWERFYQVSRQLVGGPNPDGPDTRRWRRAESTGIKKAGQYFPDDETSDMTVMSKTTFTTCGTYYQEDEDVTITDVRAFELMAQAELYTEAYDLESYDTITFTNFTPTYIKDLYKHLNMDVVQIPIPLPCTMILNKVNWEDNTFKGDLNQKGSHFQPGGHYHSWSANVRISGCGWGGYNIVHTQIFNHPKHGNSTEVMWVGHVFSGFALFGNDMYLDQRIAQIDANPIDAMEDKMNAIDDGLALFVT